MGPGTLASAHCADFKDARRTAELATTRCSFLCAFRYGSKVIADAVGAINAPRRTAEYDGEHSDYGL